MEQQNRSSRKFLILPALLVLLLLAAALSGVSAKYFKDIGGTGALVRAKEFYFSSDLLMETGAQYDLNPGTTSITFELRNHDDQLRYSEEAVTYTVTGGTVDPASGTLPGGQISTATVTLSNLEDGNTYTVTATGQSGYEKTLRATFTVRAQEEAAYKYLESDPSGAFVLLTVWTKNVQGDVTIRFPAGLIPDATDPALSTTLNYKEGHYSGNDGEEDQPYSIGTLDPYSSHTYRFFLETPYTNFSVHDFTVTVGETPATESTPK